MDIKDLITEDIIKGIYLLILLIIGGETVSTFSKQGTKLIRKSDKAKYVIIFCIIYFTIDYSKTRINHPGETLLISTFIWICYIMMSRQNVYFTIVLFLIISILYILYDFDEYYKHNYKKTNDKIYISKSRQLNKIIKYLTYIFFIVLLSGFIQYYHHQRISRKTQFNTLKFIFGSRV